MATATPSLRQINAAWPIRIEIVGYATIIVSGLLLAYFAYVVFGG